MDHLLEPELSGPIGPETSAALSSVSFPPQSGDRAASADVILPGPSLVRLRPVQQVLKRGFDVIGSLVLILLVLPLALIAALVIAVDSRGPILFVHRRVGRNEVEFPLVKFRTMIRKAEDALADHIARDEEQLDEWERSRKLRNDPRITRAGGFLRRFSIDEVPQILNVFWGHMSLVGPRPIVRDEVPYFGDRARQILGVRPGVTGLWAVSGRSNLSYEERVELEFRYASSWNLWMDAKILLRTIPAVFRGHGAY